MSIENHETFGRVPPPPSQPVGLTGSGDPRDRLVLDPSTLAVDLDEAKRLAAESDLPEPAPAEAYDSEEKPDLGDDGSNVEYDPQPEEEDA